MATSLWRLVKDQLKYVLESLGVREKRSFGLNGLDVRAADLIKIRRGFFVETGANDGVSQSNSLYFEHYLGWRGLLIEPIPELASRCRAHRRKALVEQCALVSSTFQDSEIEIQYCNLMSLVRGARGSSDEELAHVKNGTQYLRPDDKPYTIRVPARTLTWVLEKHGVKHIDFLSLDVEGYEANVLRGLDFEKFAPQYILVEANYPDEIEDALGGRYELFAKLSHHDRFYRLLEREPE
jgi:FkbM family methyltransferase